MHSMAYLCMRLTGCSSTEPSALGKERYFATTCSRYASHSRTIAQLAILMLKSCAGLEEARNTSWAELAPSEKAAMAYAFIHEEDTWLALKFLARSMASFGGSKGASTVQMCCKHSIKPHSVSYVVRDRTAYHCCAKV